MDSYNLKTASAYINNLLLARGLLRNGKPIEWANPSKGEGGKEATMASIINVVHDLILRRDRDQSAHESLAHTLRTTRTELSTTLQRTEKQTLQISDLQRQTSLSQSQERATRLALKSAEAHTRALREDIARQKTTLQQVRTACANDVRKRDVQISRLKSHLTSQQRGSNKGGVMGASIVITPGSTIGVGFGGKEKEAREVEREEGYDLRRETTEFLTQLSQSLSDENDHLIGLVRSTLGTLRELQGLPESVQLAGGHLPTVVEGQEGDEKAGMIQALPTSYEALAQDMDGLLENLRTLLTNPNFVSLEEVEMREQQIVHLRAGWQKMEERWREAVLLMESWKKRMLSGGDTVNVDELRHGLGLGVGLETVNGENDISTISEAEDEDVDEDAEVDGELTEMDEALPESLEASISEILEPPVLTSMKGKSNNTELFNLKLTRDPALQESSGNSAPKSPRKVNFAPSATSTPQAPADENVSEVSLVGRKNAQSTDSPAASIGVKKATANRSGRPTSRLPRTTSTTSSTTAPTSSTTSTRRKRPSTSPHPHERSPKLTVQQKLYAAESEAAAIAQGLQVSSRSQAAEEKDSVGKLEGDGGAGQGDGRRSPAKPSKVRGRAKRRKSTLTPGELEELMFVS